MANLNKVKVRNLDEDVLSLFRKNDEKIPYDSLDQEIINEIKNGAGTNKYNDAELRSRIIKLEGDKLDKKLAATTYMTVENSFSKEEIDSMVKVLKNNVDLKLSSDTADQRYIKKLDGCISENLLSEDLINKVNARYENKRPEETGSGSGVDTSDFNLLKVQVNNNTTGITNLENYINGNVLTTDNKITRNYLDESIVSTLDNSRLKSVLIGMSDLSEEVQRKLNNTISGSFDTLEANIQSNKNSIDEITEWLGVQNGNVLMGALGSTSTYPVLKQCQTYAEEIMIVSDLTLLNEAMAQAVEDEVEHIIVDDGENTHLYSYIDNEWKINPTIGPTELLVGRFASAYKTDDLYYGTSVDEINVVVEVSSFAKKTDLQNCATKKEVETCATKDQVSTLKSNMDTEISNLKTQIESMKAQIESLKAQVEALKTPTP